MKSQWCRTGKATEHTYRGALRDLVAAFLPGTTVLNEPKRIECGAPDFIIARSGMFAARLHDDTPEDFTRYEAAALIPKSNPFLKQLFTHIASGSVRLSWFRSRLFPRQRRRSCGRIVV